MDLIVKIITILASFMTLAACEGAGQSTPASVTDGTPDLVAPIDGGSDNNVVVPGPTPISLTYYKLSRTEAPMGSWPTKTYTVTGNCVTYNSSVYCWDDGVKTLAWSSGGYNYGPYTYTYFGFMENGASFISCYGGCGTDLMPEPRLLSYALANNIGTGPVNTIFSTGTPVNVTCTEANGELSCGDFTIDLNQAAL